MEKILLVLAAGMGSRFGGLKQIEPVGPNGEFIIDYSVYDAIKAGFTKVVFVIKEENYEVFKDTIGKRIDGKIKVEYAFQKLDDVPLDINIKREKPLGTGHAMYAARKYLTDPFVIINADDFYGYDSYQVLSKFLEEKKGLGLVGYNLDEVLSSNGAVKRGIIFSEDGMVSSIKESSCIKDSNGILCIPLNKDASFYATSDNKAGMSMYGFNLDFMDLIKSELEVFLKSANLEKDEYLIPDVIEKYIKNGGSVKLLDTKANWYGMTYREDLEDIKNKIANYIKEGKYPNNLWEE